MSVQRRPKTGKDQHGKVTWVARYYDPSGKQRSKSFPTKREAEAHEQEQLRLLRRREWVDDDNAPTLGNLWPLWEAAATTTGTRRVRKLVGQNLGDLAKTRITRIRPTQLRTWQAHLRDGRPWANDRSGLALNTRVSWWTQLSGCLSMAVTDELLLVNPCSKVPGPGAGTAPVEHRTIPTIEQVRDAVTLADSTGRGTMATMILLAAATGMRPGEVGGLRWRSVDRQAGVIRVTEQTVQRPGDGDGWGSVKTRASRRVVPVPGEIMARLMRHRLAHPAAADDAMFRTSAGNLWASDRINHAVKALTGGAWTFHALRHLYATTMLTSGRSIKAVQRVLGHSSASTTIDTYWHFLPDEEDLVRNTASSLVRDLQGIDAAPLRTVGGDEGGENRP